MGFDTPGGKIKTKAHHKKEKEKWEKAGKPKPTPSGPAYSLGKKAKKTKSKGGGKKATVSQVKVAPVKVETAAAVVAPVKVETAEAVVAQVVQTTKVEPQKKEVGVPSPPGRGEKASPAYVAYLKKHKPRSIPEIEAEKAKKALELAKAPAPPKKGEKATPEYVKFLEKAPPPQLLVSKEFKVHPDWAVADRDAKGNPSVFTDPEGVRWYAPGTPMFDMGYANSLEYRGYRTTVLDPDTGKVKAIRVGGGAVSDNPKAKAPWVAMTNAKGDPLLVPKAEIARISKLSDEAQIKALRKLGILPEATLKPATKAELSIKEKQALALEGVKGTRKTIAIIAALKREKPALEKETPAYHEAVRIPLSSAASQENYLKEIEQYSRDVKQFNIDVKNLDEYVDWIEEQAERLKPKLNFIDKQNRLIAQFETESDELIALATTINPLDVKQVEEYNNRINRFNTKLANFKVPEKKIQGIIKELDQYNDKVAALNLRYDKLNVPEEPPAPKEGLGSFVVKAWHGTKQSFKEATAEHLSTAEKVKNVSGLAAEMFFPGLWARHWNQLGWGERGFNIAMDMVIMIPLLKLSSIGLRAITRKAGSATIKQFLKRERGYTTFLADKLKPRFGKAVADQFKLISKTQSRYLEQLIKLDRLKLKKAQSRRIEAQERIVRKTKVDLEQQARQFVDEIKVKKQEGVPYGWGFDDPRLAEVFNRLPKDIIAHTESIASSLVPKRGNIKALKADLFAAEQRLQAAQVKKGAWKDPSQFSDLIEDVMFKQVKLNQALAGSIEEIQKELLKLQTLRSKLTKAELKAKISELRKSIGKLQTQAKQPWLSARQKALIKTKIDNLQLELSHLPKAKQPRLTAKQRASLKTRAEELKAKLDQAIKKMEVEWSQSGFLRKGRVAADFTPPPPGRPSGGLAQALKQMELKVGRPGLMRPPSGGAIIGTRAFVGSGVAVLGKALTQADLELVMGRVTDPAEQDAIAIETLKAIKTATKLRLKGLTKSEIEAKIKEQLKESLKPHLLPATKAALKAQAKPITRTALKTATKVEAKPATKPALKAEAKPITKTAPKTATKVAVKPSIKPVTKVAVTTKAPVKIPPPRPRMVPRLSSDSSDEEKREFIKQTPGAVTWNMGKLGKEAPEDVWHVRMPDGKHVVVIGKAPKGAKILAEGPGSAYKTAQTTGPRRTPFPKFRQRHGAVTATLEPSKLAKGAKISFSQGLRSEKKGRMFKTKMGRSTAYSRHPLGRRR